MVAWFDECLDPVSQEHVGLSLRLKKRVPQTGLEFWRALAMVVHSGVATHASGIDRNTTMRSPNEKENKLERGSSMVLVHCVPRAQ